MIKNALVLCIILAVVFFLYLPSYLKMQGLHEKNEAYQKKIMDLEEENIAFQEERRRLIDDPEYLERVAREKMGLIKDGEMIYKVVPYGEKTSNSDAARGLIRE